MSADAKASGCPMPDVQNVAVDPAAEGLSKERQVSSIPRAGTSGSWIYPSAQMFYNALRRKGEDIDTKALDAVISAHNACNERAWGRIMEWEQFHKSEGAEPRLLKFRGRPNDLSPKARFYTLLGYEPPFDRHDWIIDRNGTEVRYVIDYYTKEPDVYDKTSILIDARPAVDSPASVVDRVRMLAHNIKTTWA